MSPGAGLGLWLDLVKFRISLAATFSAVAVCALAGQGFGPRAVPLGLGVFFLACGACALNESAERDRDRLMRRTQGRPIPSGRMSPARAWLAAGVLLSAGLALIFWVCGAAGGLLGAAAVAWYDGVYVRLKSTTPFAAVPGALVGAVPPALGWAAGGGAWRDSRLLAICLFFILWQVPHFWLLVPGYREDLDRAGLPSLAKILGEPRLARLTAVWMSVAAAAGLLLPAFGVLHSAAGFLCLAAAAAWLVRHAAVLLRGTAGGAGAPFQAAFVRLNIFVLAATGLIASDPFLSSRLF